MFDLNVKKKKKNHMKEDVFFQNNYRFLWDEIKLGVLISNFVNSFEPHMVGNSFLLFSKIGQTLYELMLWS